MEVILNSQKIKQYFFIWTLIFFVFFLGWSKIISAQESNNTLSFSGGAANTNPDAFSTTEVPLSFSTPSTGTTRSFSTTTSSSSNGTPVVTPTNASSFNSAAFIGCGESIYNQATQMQNLLVKQSLDTVKETITKSADAGIMTCGEQHLQGYEDVLKVFSLPDGGGTGFFADIQNSFKSSVVGQTMSNLIPGSADETVAKAYEKSVSSNAGKSLSDTTCTMMDDLWLAQSCDIFAGVPNIGDIISNEINKVTNSITGLVEDIANIPSRLSEAVCNASSDFISDLYGDIEDAADDAVSSFTDPITDSIDNVTNKVEEEIDKIY